MSTERKVYVTFIGKDDGVVKNVDVISNAYNKLKKEVGKNFELPNKIETKNLLADIKKFETERARIAKQNSYLMQNLRKEETKALDQEGKAQVRSFKRDMSEIAKSAKDSAVQTRSAFSQVFQGSFFGSLAGNVVSGIAAQFSKLPGIALDYLDQMVDISQERANAIKGLESTALFKGVDPSTAQESVKNLRLVKAGILDLKDAATGYKSLLASELNDEQSVKILERFSDAAAFGKQSALSFGEAISRAAEGIKNQNSELVDNVGLTKNLSVILKERGFELEDLSNKTKGQNAILALYNGILEETKGQVGDADKLTQGYTGSTAALTTAQNNLLAAYGDFITTSPQMTEANKILTEQINEYTGGVQNADSETGQFTRNAVNNYALLKARALNTAAGIVEAFKLSGLSIAFGITTVIGGITAIVEGAVALVRKTAYDAVKAVSDLVASSGKFIAPFLDGVNPTWAAMMRSQSPAPMPEKTLSEFMPATNDLVNKTNTLIDQIKKSYGRMETLSDEIRAINARVGNASNSNTKFETIYLGKNENDLGGGGTSKSKSGRLSSATKNFQMSPEAKAIIDAAKKLGISPIDLATIISYETAGTFSTKKWGGKNNDYLGLIQFGKEERQKYGVSGSQSFERQLIDSVVPFFKDRFASVGRITEGATLLDLYKTVNGGNPNVSSNASDGYRIVNGRRVRNTIAGHVTQMSGNHRQKALGRFFGGSAANIGDDDFQISNAEKSSQFTAAVREKNLRNAFDWYKKMGLMPGDMLNSFTQLMIEDAKQAGTTQPTKNDVAQIFENARIAKQDGIGIIADPGGTVSSNITSRPTVDEKYISNLRESLGLTSKSADEESRYFQLVMRRRNIIGEMTAYIESDVLRQQEDLVDLEVRLGIQKRENDDAEFTANRRRISALSEEYQLNEDIAEVRDRIANVGVNSAKRYERAWLNAIYEIKDANERAVEDEIRANVRLADSATLHSEQVRARVLSHLAEQKTLSESLADGIISAFDKASNFITKSFGKMGEIPIIGDLLKFSTNQTLSKITTSLLDKFIPGGSEIFNQTKNPIAAPIVEQQKTTNKLLAAIAGKAGVSPASLISGGIGGLATTAIQAATGGGIGGLFGSGQDPNNSNIFHFGGGAGASGSRTGDILDGAVQVFAGDKGRQDVFSNLKYLFSSKDGAIFGKGGIFGDKGFGNNVGTYGAVGAGAGMIGGLVGGRAGGFISNIGGGIALGAQIGSIVPGVGTAIGALVGGGIGLLASIFGGDPKRKKDKKENLPALNKGFTDAFAEFQQLISDTKSLRVDADSALSRGTELRGQIASGFGIEFLSKKYRKQAQSLIQQKLLAIDQKPGGLMEQLQQAVEIAKAAGERRQRILPEFADGGAVSAFFTKNFSGLVPGQYDRKDDKLIKVSGNEVVLTPKDWQPITPYLQAKRVPGFANGGYVGNSGAKSGDMNFTVELNNVTVNEKSSMTLTNQETLERKFISLYKNAKKNKEI